MSLYSRLNKSHPNKYQGSLSLSLAVFCGHITLITSSLNIHWIIIIIIKQSNLFWDILLSIFTNQIQVLNKWNIKVWWSKFGGTSQIFKIIIVPKKLGFIGLIPWVILRSLHISYIFTEHSLINNNQTWQLILNIVIKVCLSDIVL